MSTDREAVTGLSEQAAALRAIRASAVARYALAVGAAVIAVLLRLALDPVWGIRLPYITLFPGIMLSAWLGGFWPGIVTTVLCATAAEYFWIEPSRSWAVADKSELLGLLVFLVVGAGISALNEAWRRGTAGVAESEGRLSVTLASIGDAVIATDEQGRVTQLNPVAEALTGWTEADAVGKRLEEVFVIINEQTRRPAENPIGKVLREHVIVGLANHTVLISKDGREIPVDDSAAPIKTAEGHVTGAVMVFRDVSERRRIERERMALVEAEGLARADAEHANRLKDQFLAMVSHELRTPLNAVLGWADILQRGDIDRTKRGRALSAIYTNARRQVQLIDELLDVSRIISGKLRLERAAIDLADIVRNAVDLVQPSADRKRVDLTLHLGFYAGWTKATKAMTAASRTLGK